MVSELQALESLRSKLAGAAFLLGACAGFMKGWYAPGELNLMFETLVGGMAVPLAGVVGGVAGLVARLGLASLMGGERGPGEPMDAPAVLLLGVVWGGFLGILGALMFVDPGAARTGALAGAVLGGLVMAGAGDMGDVLLRMTLATGRVPLDKEHSSSPLEELDEREGSRDAGDPDDTRRH